MNHYQYLLLMSGCVILTLPLEFACGGRVWRRPKRLALSVLPILVLFIVWDVWATRRGTWSFDDRYTVAWKLPGNVAVEELLFFVVIPVCGLLTLESVRNVLAGTTPFQQWLRDR